MCRNKSECKIVYLDDSLDDLILFQAAVLSTGVNFRTEPFLNHEGAVARLHRKPPFEEAELPALFLCDYDLGRARGCEVAKQIRQAAICETLPIIIFSGGVSDEVVARSYTAGANGFLSKPTIPRRMEMVVLRLYDYASSRDVSQLETLLEYQPPPPPG